jgi:hypothetical protein
MKFDERNQFFLNTPFFYFHGNSQLRQSLSYPYWIRFKKFGFLSWNFVGISTIVCGSF